MTPSSGPASPRGKSSVAAATLEEAAASVHPAAAAHGLLKQYGSEALSHGLSVGARRQLVWWLGGTAAWVYSMVVLGGVTRLTRSGLSMTEWKFTGTDCVIHLSR